ncbi:MAG TPA: SDR family NAD(P)-dependent oxidoreductase [Steroidobacteraceae bacterium]|nr:SDR family NAD(P)-dependent oxidoreductase [Steroidobacteraceae bacterium]
MSRSAMVTGAAMGMGMLMARKLAQRGWTVFAGVLPGADTSELTRAVQLTVIEQDVRDEAMVQAGARRVGEVLSGTPLDLLINNAGIADIATGPVEGVNIEEGKLLFDVNLFGQVRVIKAFLPLMFHSRQSPRIFNFSSGAVRVPMPCSAMYNMSKYGVEGLTNTLRYELAKFGIQVTSIEPGAVKTHMTADPINSTARIWERSSAQIRARYEAKLRPITDRLGRMLLTANEPDEVTDGVLKLLEVARLKPRYMVGKEVRMLPLMQALLSEGAFERLVAKQFKI